MTNNFTPKKSGAAARPQLSPEEYAAKKKAEKDAVYQMIDDTATEIVSDPDKFRAYLDTQARMDRYSAANALLIYKQQPQATQLKDFRDWQEDGVKVNKGAKSLSICQSNRLGYYLIKRTADASQMAAEIKTLFIRNHIYLHTDSEKDVQVLRERFLEWKYRNACKLNGKY